MKKKLFKVITVMSLLCFAFEAPMVYATNSSDIKDKINNNNQTINKLEQEKDKLGNEVNNVNKELDALTDQINSKNKELEASSKVVNEFQSKIDNIQAEINKVQEKIKNTEYEISTKEKLIDEKEAEAEKRDELLGIRLRNYYKNGMSSQIIAFLVGSDGLADFIGNIYSLEKILSSDKSLIDELNNIKESLAKEKASLEKEAVKLNEEKASIEGKKQELVDAQKEFLDEQNKYLAQMNDLKSIERKKQRMIDSLSDQEKRLQAQIGELEDFNQSLQKELDDLFNEINSGSSNVENNAGEGFMRPTSGVVTSEYGARKHPISGQSGFHTGIDLAPPRNTAIKAAKSGKVVYSGWQGGYGQVVIIDHGGGIQTLYAHCETLKVSYGQNVSKGQVIALVGSTGNSTGPHLHFEVRKNGKHQNPRNYVPI